MYYGDMSEKKSTEQKPVQKPAVVIPNERPIGNRQTDKRINESTEDRPFRPSSVSDTIRPPEDPPKPKKNG